MLFHQLNSLSDFLLKIRTMDQRSFTLVCQRHKFDIIIKQGNEDLNARLEQILSMEEYQDYLRSMPPMLPPPNNVGAAK